MHVSFGLRLEISAAAADLSVSFESSYVCMCVWVRASTDGRW